MGLEDWERNMETVVTSFSMSMAWSFFFGTRWSLSMWGKVWNGNQMLLAEAIAVVISVSCFLVIFALDKIKDAEWTGAKTDACIGQIISAIGILVGFSWEQTFDASVSALASRSHDPVGVKLLLGVCSAILVVPAWRFYMLPMIVHEGWRYGFVGNHVSKYMDAKDPKAMEHFYKQLEHLIVGHPQKMIDKHPEKFKKRDPTIKKQICDLLKEELKTLEKEVAVQG